SRYRRQLYEGTRDGGGRHARDRRRRRYADQRPPAGRRMSIRVVVADDHPLFRQGLRDALEATAGIEVVGEAATGLEAVRVVVDLEPDVVLMDLQMPEATGVEATRRILDARPETHILVLTMFDNDSSVFAAIRAGARGYLLKGA